MTDIYNLSYTHQLALVAERAAAAVVIEVGILSQKSLPQLSLDLNVDWHRGNNLNLLHTLDVIHLHQLLHVQFQPYGDIVVM